MAGIASGARYTVMVSVIAAIWAVYLVLLIQHHYKLTHPKFQAVYLRIVLIFPLAASLVALFAFVGLAGVGDTCLSVLEGYIFVAFFGLMVCWGWQHGNVYEALNSNFRTQTMCATRCCSCGPRMRNRAMLNSLWYQCFQLMIVKPITSALKFIIVEISPTDTIGRGPNMALSAVALISVLLATLSLFRVYHALHYFAPDKDKPEEKKSLLRGLKPFSKFLIIKLLVFLVVINSLVFSNLIPDVMHVPQFLCDPQYADTRFCEEWYKAFIFSCEALIIALPAALFFKSAEKYFAIPESQRKNSVMCSILKHYFLVHDVWTSFLREPVGTKLVHSDSSASEMHPQSGPSLELHTSNEPSQEVVAPADEAV